MSDTFICATGLQSFDKYNMIASLSYIIDIISEVWEIISPFSFFIEILLLTYLKYSGLQDVSL